MQTYMTLPSQILMTLLTTSLRKKTFCWYRRVCTFQKETIKLFDLPWFTAENRKLLKQWNRKYKEYKHLTKLPDLLKKGKCPQLIQSS